MRLKRETRQGIQRVAGFVIALSLGALVAIFGFWLPPAMQDSPVAQIDPADQEMARTALADAELAFFDDGVERYLVTVTFVDYLVAGNPPEVCPDGTEFHARVRARTAWWIPYDDVLWCGSAAGDGLFVTRQG